MSNMIAKVSFMPGTALADAIQEAKEKSILWNVEKVEFNFNGKSFSIGRNANIGECLEAYQKGGNYIFS